MNMVVLCGNLTRDPETHSAGGTTITNFGVAVTERFKRANGEKGEKTAFVDCKAWGATGENIRKYFEKGSKILIQGKLDFETWDDKTTGAKRSKLTVMVTTFDFVGERKRERSSEPIQTTNQDKPSVPTYEPISEDQIPF